LTEYLLVQRTMERSKHSKRTLTVIAKIQQIVQLRVQSLERTQKQNSLEQR